MTTVAGVRLSASSARLTGSSATLAAHAPWDGSSRGTGQDDALSGPSTDSSGLTFASASAQGLPRLGPGSEVWDRVHVLPRVWSAGMVLSDRMKPVHVWSAHRRLVRQLQDVAVSGGSGVGVQGATSGIWYPSQSVEYAVALYSSGTPVVDNLVVWTFSAEQGTDLTITGTRVTVFPHRPDWSEPYRQTVVWVTEVLTAYSGMEQRRSLATSPRAVLDWRVLTTSPSEAAYLEALLWDHQGKGRRFGVPIWPEQTVLVADVGVGGVVLQADTTDRPSFVAGGLVMVWSAFDAWEAFRVLTVTPTEITLETGTTRSWQANTRVVPLRLGGLGQEQALGHPTNWISEGRFTFLCEGPL